MSIHIEAKPGDIADKILLPGDPLRAKFIAENFLEDAVCFNNIRGMLGYTELTKDTASALWEQVWECHLSLSMPTN